MAPQLYDCSKCSAIAPEDRITEHFIRTHVDNLRAPWLCTLCGFKAVSRQHINNHNRHFMHLKAKMRYPNEIVEYIRSANPYKVTKGRDILPYHVETPNYFTHTSVYTVDYQHNSLRRSVDADLPAETKQNEISSSPKKEKRSSTRSESDHGGKRSKIDSEKRKESTSDETRPRRSRRGKLNTDDDSKAKQPTKPETHKNTGLSSDERSNRPHRQGSRERVSSRTATITRPPTDRNEGSVSTDKQSSITTEGNGTEVEGRERIASRTAYRKRPSTDGNEGSLSADKQNSITTEGNGIQTERSRETVASKTATTTRPSEGEETSVSADKQNSTENETEVKIKEERKDHAYEGHSAEVVVIDDDDDASWNQEGAIMATLEGKISDLIHALEPLSNVSKALIALDHHMRKLVPVVEKLNETMNSK